MRYLDLLGGDKYKILTPRLIILIYGGRDKLLNLNYPEKLTRIPCSFTKILDYCKRAAETLDRVTGFDREPESIYFGIANTPSSR